LIESQIKVFRGFYFRGYETAKSSFRLTNRRAKLD